MADDELTLRSLLFAGGEGQEPGALPALDQLSEVREEFKKQLPKVGWGLVEEELRQKLEEVLGTRISEALGAAWGKYQGLSEYADPDLHPPGETAMVPLANHSIHSAHSPRIDILIRELSIGSLGIDVELELKLEGVVLRIQGGRILAARAGSLQGRGSLECTFRRGELAKRILRLDKEIPKFRLDREMSFKDGIPVPPRRS